MKITRLKTNRVINPLGFSLDKPRISYVVTDTKAKKQKAALVTVSLDITFAQVVFTSGIRDDIDNLAYEIQIELQPRTRYYWRVEVWADNGDYAISDIAWFETAKLAEPWQAKWITPVMDKDIHPVLCKSFDITGDVSSARAYVCGLGLYEMQVNGDKTGNEYLTPHFNAYHEWLQYQTYDVTDQLLRGENQITVCLGNGLYKGRFGFDGRSAELYGNEFALLCEIVVSYTDGSTEVISTDDSWTAVQSCIKSGNLYDGEVYDASFQALEIYSVREAKLGYDLLKARLSLPVVIKEERQPVELLLTPSGETVLDMGQNMVGWIQFRTTAPLGSTIRLQYGEVLQNGNFYRDNLRTAKAEYLYTANGHEVVVRPYFTYYGFRYVKIEGWIGELNPNDFTACVLYSDMEETGDIETSDPLVNRLFLNALWGQRGNFLDVPTDCPQRDERMGWTGDAQVFSGTASFNMDTYAFYNKYCYDLKCEQETMNGMVPLVVPSANVQRGGSSAWADAATIIPWNVYTHYGDKAILEQQFASMKAWADYIIREDEGTGGQRLWTTGFHFGDWLALDNGNPDSPFGGTDTVFIASAYYSQSAELVAKAARVLGNNEDADYYERISREVKTAIQDEFFTKNGRLAIDTQTAYVLTLYMNLAPDPYRSRVVEGLQKRLKADGYHLRTGFVGTPYITWVLSENGCNDLAYTLLLNDDYPSWLYAVKLGATTIWERWNSILPDGTISGTGMNSLNHYAYGAVVEWMYRTMGGINPVEEEPGYRHAVLAPKPDARLKWSKVKVETASGRYRSEWSISEEGGLTFQFEIPFNTTALVCLPYAELASLEVNGSAWREGDWEGEQIEEEVKLTLSSGIYVIRYSPTQSYLEQLSTMTPLSVLMENEEAAAFVRSTMSSIIDLNADSLSSYGTASFRDLANIFQIPLELLDRVDSQLSQLSYTRRKISEEI